MKAACGLIAAMLMLAGAISYAEMPDAEMPRGEIPGAQLNALAMGLAGQMAQACPHAAPGDVDAFKSCAAALRHTAAPAFAPGGMLWGGDQPALRLRKKKLTHFSAAVFDQMYLPLFSFTGRWTIGHDDRDGLAVIHVEAYFRNAPAARRIPLSVLAQRRQMVRLRNRQPDFVLSRSGRNHPRRHEIGRRHRGGAGQLRPRHPAGLRRQLAVDRRIRKKPSRKHRCSPAATAPAIPSSHGSTTPTASSPPTCARALACPVTPRPIGPAWITWYCCRRRCTRRAKSTTP